MILLYGNFMQWKNRLQPMSNVLSIFGFNKYSSVTTVLLQLGLPSFNKCYAIIFLDLIID